jgi:nucleoside-diphosphate-sugar epimerase
MEKRLREATTLGVRTLIVRAGDYFGPRAGNNWFTQGLLAGSTQVRRVFYPGPRELGHSWAYLPDVAETVARLLEAEDRLEAFAVFHFRGHWLARGVEMAETIGRVAGLRTKRIFGFPWWAVRIAAPFVEVCREMLEMRYLWRVAAELDNTKLRSVIGVEPHTPLEEAVRAALANQTVAGA